MKILVAGAQGFVGRALCPALVAAGHVVRAGARRPSATTPGRDRPDHGEPGQGEPGQGEPGQIAPVHFDLDDESTLRPALQGVDAVVWLVHGLQHASFASWEETVAARFAAAARDTGLRRLVYLGGVLPTTLTAAGRVPAAPSEHLRARQRTGERLREAAASVLELRAGIIVGGGGASFRLLRDLAVRAPLLVRVPWLAAEQQPVALADVVAALVAVVDRDVAGVLDVPGPTIVTTEALLRRTAALLGRQVRFVDVRLPPALVVEAAARLTRADGNVVRGILGGVDAVDLVAPDDGVFALVPGLPRTPLDVALRSALVAEERSVGPATAAIEEALGLVWGHR
jgi:uncharacterized protein YbjT (DUF2867 family)